MFALRHDGLIVSIVTAVVLTKMNHFLRWKPLGMPSNLMDNQYMSWKWRNISISLIHSIVSAFAGLLALVIEPSLALDMVHSYSRFAYLVLCFSNGYFVYDLILSVTNISYPGRIEIIVHHFLTIGCLTVSTTTKRFMGYCMTALIVEISNIFLHLRQLFLICGIRGKSKTYRVNSILTIISLIIMRFFPLSWIGFCLYMETDSIDVLIWFLSTFSVIAILVVSVGIIVRVVIKDFIQKQN